MKRIAATLLLFATGAAVAADPPVAPPRVTLGAGYFPAGTPPLGLMVSPPPPVPGSAAEARDEEAQRAALALQGTARWTLAAVDADLFTPSATATMSCAAGIAISETTTPRTHALLRKAAADLGMSTSTIKRQFQRQRPFMVNNQPSCTPQMEPLLRRDGSYPSGHAAIGYGWGLILAELLPARADQLVTRGRAFADSRRICNVHWLSDVQEGSNAGAAVVARLHAIPAFTRDMVAARRELARARALPQNCEAEAAALALSNGIATP